MGVTKVYILSNNQRQAQSGFANNFPYDLGKSFLSYFLHSFLFYFLRVLKYFEKISKTTVNSKKSRFEPN